jgi:hypothetical protein
MLESGNLLPYAEYQFGKQTGRIIIVRNEMKNVSNFQVEVVTLNFQSLANGYILSKYLKGTRYPITYKDFSAY